jgi:hypothetical protein
MRLIIRIVLTVICYTMFAACVNAQAKNISGEFNNVKFPDFVKTAETATSCHFYYDETELDSFTLNLNLVNQSLPDALKQIFTNTDFRYSIDALNHVFIVKNKVLQTTLAADFFNREKKANGEENEEPLTEDVKKEKTKAAFI